MKGKLFTLVVLMVVCAATANSQGPLLSKTVPGVNATSNVIVNATLDPAFILSGTIHGDSASVPDTIAAMSNAGSFTATINTTNHTYRIVLPAGTYNLIVTFTRTTSSQATSFTYTDLTSPAPVTVSADTIRDINLPAVITSAVTGAITNLNALFSNSRSVTFSSSSVSGFTNVSASSPLDGSGNYSVQLPNGTFMVELSQSTGLSFTTFSTSSLNSSLGSGMVSGPTTLNFAAPTVPTANLSGMVTFTGSPVIPNSSLLSGTDVSGGTPPASISSGAALIGLSAGAAYGFIFGTSRTYALNPTVPVQLLPMPAPAGIFSPPDPGPALLTADTMRNVNYPALPGPATGFTISGRVTITGTITPVANASVFVSGMQITGASNTSFARNTTTDANGNYSLLVPAGTNYTLVFQGQFVTSGDFNGDGKADVAVWRESSGTWFVIESDPSFLVQQWGTVGDIPVRGDYDGDGLTDIAVWRPSDGVWYVIPSGNPSAITVQQWGTEGDIPVPGDYDGDGKTDFAVFRPSSGTWFIIPSSNPGSPIVQQWGTNGDIPVPGDYDGDGKIDFGVFRPSSGTWFIIPSSNPGSPIVKQWGASGDIPVPVDYDRDRKTDIAVWRPSGGNWFIIPSSAPSTFTITQWGTNGDVPVQKPIGK